ncbi:uncharacterized protein LOC120011950 isoform X10 [Tripterygium wilfordii]|uniref:uncharacterized protein LOC120011950 isoform X10 n=1 Tax=Tripterygium wilfordii TaxID=458696 RepID=UPI0018F8505C|nr:uncharacterized protein LOC120011950 isoform X10 [Tripterygium wilfordii]
MKLLQYPDNHSLTGASQLSSKWFCEASLSENTCYSFSAIYARRCHFCSFLSGARDIMSGMRDVKEQEKVDGNGQDESEKPMPSSEEEEVAIKKKYGGIVPKKPPLISKDHERAYFDSADWALGKQGAEKPKGPLEALRPKLQIFHSG